MKEAMSMTTIFQIVVLFILLFTAIMALTINNSNAFAVKDEVLNYLELNNGNYVDGDRLNDDIIEILSNASYRTTGKCDDDFAGYARNGERVNDGEYASICINEVTATADVDSYLLKEVSDLNGKLATGDFVVGKYYQIKVFFQLDLPVVKQIYNFSTKGETKVIYKN